MSHPLRWLALIALPEARLPSFDAVAERYAALFPDAPTLALSASTDNLLAVTVGEDTAAITLVPRPIPWSQLEGPAATAWYWPEAAGVLRDHSAHLLVTVIDEGGKPIQKALALTRLAAAAVAAAEGVGVFWGPGRLVHPPAAFIDQTGQMSERNLPLYLWVDFRVEQFGEGTMRLYTTGLEPLGGSELEAPSFQGEPQRLMEFAYNIAHYQLDRKKVIKDGDTIGLTEDVQVTARRGRSMLGGELEVIRLEFEGGAPRSP
jgi:hypothetical protein